MLRFILLCAAVCDSSPIHMRRGAPDGLMIKFVSLNCSEYVIYDLGARDKVSINHYMMAMTWNKKCAMWCTCGRILLVINQRSHHWVIFKCDQASVWMVQSVRLSVCPSIRLPQLFHYVPTIVWTGPFIELLGRSQNPAHYETRSSWRSYSFAWYCLKKNFNLLLEIAHRAVERVHKPHLHSSVHFHGAVYSHRQQDEKRFVQLLFWRGCPSLMSEVRWTY